jgi:hypothetical protein
VVSTAETSIFSRLKIKFPAAVNSVSAAQTLVSAALILISAAQTDPFSGSNRISSG